MNMEVYISYNVLINLLNSQILCKSPIMPVNSRHARQKHFTEGCVCMCNGMCNQCKELEGGKMRNVTDADSFPGLVNCNLDKGKFI